MEELNNQILQFTEQLGDKINANQHSEQELILFSKLTDCAVVIESILYPQESD